MVSTLYLLYLHSLKVHYYSFCDTTCANDTYAWGAPSSQVSLLFMWGKG